jgi:hypothetical protein
MININTNPKLDIIYIKVENKNINLPDLRIKYPIPMDNRIINI